MPVEHFCWGGWWLFPVVMLVLMVAGMTLCFGRGGSRPPWWGMRGGPPDAESAMDILRKRYAKGGINKDEFERMKKDLQ